MQKKLILCAVLFLTIGLTAQTYAAGTAAGTVITNTVYGNYQDADGQAMTEVTASVSVTVAQVAGVDVTDPADQDVAHNSSVDYSVTVTNTGNGDDTFSLGAVNSPSANFFVAIYEDTDGDGVLDPGELSAGEITDTGVMSADATYKVIVRVTASGASQGDQTTTTLTATSNFDGGVSASSDFVTTVTAAELAGAIDVDATVKNPGDVITYTIDYNNNSGDETAYNTIMTLPIPAQTTFVPGSITGGSATLVGVNWEVDLGDIAPAGSGTVTYQVTVNEDATGTIDNIVTIDYENSQGESYTQISLNTATAGKTVTVDRSYGVTTAKTSADQDGPANTIVDHIFTVTNDGNGLDSFVMDTTNTYGWTWAFYIDDGNGSYNVGDTPITDGGDGTYELGNIASGSSITVIARVTIPGGEPDQTSNAMQVTVTSVGDGNESDSETLNTTVNAPLLVLEKEVNPSGSQPPGTTLTYTIRYKNSGHDDARNVVLTDPIPGNTVYVVGSASGSGVTITYSHDGGSNYDGSDALPVTHIKFTFTGDLPDDDTFRTVTFQVTIQ